MLRVRVHVPGLLALLPGGQHAQEEEQHDLRLVRVHDRLDQHGLRPYGLEQGGQAEDGQAEGDQDEQADWNGAELLAHPWHELLQQMVVLFVLFRHLLNRQRQKTDHPSLQTDRETAQEIECDYALVLPVLLLGTNYDLYLLQPWDCEHELGHHSSACEVLVHLF